MIRYLSLYEDDKGVIALTALVGHKAIGCGNASISNGLYCGFTCVLPWSYFGVGLFPLEVQIGLPRKKETRRYFTEALMDSVLEKRRQELRWLAGMYSLGGGTEIGLGR